MNEDGTGMIRLTKAVSPSGKPANNEDPTWSADGRFVMYTSDRTGKSQIYFSTADGAEERRVTLDNHNYYKVKWSDNL
jgi:TolB protein